MSPDRTHTPDEGELRLKIATQRMVKALHGTALAAEVAGCRQQRISDCQVTNTREYLRIDEALRVEEAAKGSPHWPAVTRALAQAHGFALLPLPDCSGLAGATDWHAAVATCSRETGEVVARVCAALGDGKVTPDEIREGGIRDEIRQAIDTLALLDSLCERAEKAGEK